MEYLKFIPAWNGNRENEKPITIEIHPLTRREVMVYVKLVKQKHKKGFRQTSDNFEDNSAEIQEKQFLDNVGKVENLKNILTGKDVVDAQGLYDAPGCSDLYAEVINAMEDASTLMEGEEKNFEPQSDGRSTKVSGETVNPA